MNEKGKIASGISLIALLMFTVACAVPGASNRQASSESAEAGKPTRVLHLNKTATPILKTTVTPLPTPTPLPLPVIDETSKSYDEETGRLVQEFASAKKASPDYELPELGKEKAYIKLIPLDERLFFIQNELFGDDGIGDPDAAHKIYVAYSYERRGDLYMSAFPVLATPERAPDTQAIITTIQIVVEHDDEFLIVVEHSSKIGSGSKSLVDMVTKSVDELAELGQYADATRKRIVNILANATGLVCVGKNGEVYIYNGVNDAIRLGARNGIEFTDELPRIFKFAYWNLNSPNWSDRNAAVMNIDQIGPSSAGMLPKLIEMLGDEHRSVRGSVAKALYEIGGVSILDQVIQVSEKNPNPEARAAAVHTLRYFEDVEPAIQQIGEVLIKDKSEEVRLEAVKSLDGLPQYNITMPYLIQALAQEDSENVALNVAYVLGGLNSASPEIIDALLDALKSNLSRVVKAQAACSLGKNIHAGEEIIEPLLEAYNPEEDFSIYKKVKGCIGSTYHDFIIGAVGAITGENFKTYESTGGEPYYDERVFERWMEAWQDQGQ